MTGLEIKALMAAGQMAAQIPQNIGMAVNAYRMNRKANKLSKRFPRPTYKTPEEVTKGLQLANMAYNNPDMTNENIAVDRLNTGAANTARNLKNSAASGSDMIAALSSIGNGVNNSLQDLAAANANEKNQLRGAVQNQYQNVAGYKDKEFSYNRDVPYQNAQAAAAALKQESKKQFDTLMNSLYSGSTNALKSVGGMMGGKTGGVPNIGGASGAIMGSNIGAQGGTGIPTEITTALNGMMKSGNTTAADLQGLDANSLKEILTKAGVPTDMILKYTSDPNMMSELLKYLTI